MSKLSFESIEYFMQLAFEQALLAYKIKEVPIGAIVVDGSGKLLASSHNKKEAENNPVGHAELLAMMNASKEIGDWRLDGCTLLTTLEPCTMCLGAMVNARISQLIFGAYDPKGGALSLGYNLHKDSRLNHNFQVIGGIQSYNSSKLLSQFFKEMRGKNS